MTSSWTQNKWSKCFISILLLALSLMSGGQSKVYGQQFIEDFEGNPLFNRFDFRLVPEFQQVDQAIQSLDKFESVEQVYHSQSGQSFQSSELQVSINSVTLYQLGRSQQEGMIQMNPPGLLLINASLTNISDKELFLAKDILKLSTKFEDYSQSQAEYFPLESGLLEQILEGDQGYLKPEQTIEGYLVFYLHPLDFQVHLRQAYVELILGQVQTVLGQHVQVRDSLQGQDLKLVLALSQEKAESLAESKQFIQDRISQEWWGNKKLIARMDQKLTKQYSGLGLSLNRIEITDLDPRPEYKQVFSDFRQGQILVTVSYQLENLGTDYKLVDLKAIEDCLTINDKEFHSEPQLIISNPKTYLTAKEKIDLQRVYVLDKAYYQKFCQGKDLTFSLSLFNKRTASIIGLPWRNLAKIGQANLWPLDQKTGPDTYRFTYLWTPTIKLKLSKDLVWTSPDD